MQPKFQPSKAAVDGRDRLYSNSLTTHLENLVTVSKVRKARQQGFGCLHDKDLEACKIHHPLITSSDGLPTNGLTWLQPHSAVRGMWLSILWNVHAELIWIFRYCINLPAVVQVWGHSSSNAFQTSSSHIRRLCLGSFESCFACRFLWFVSLIKCLRSPAGSTTISVGSCNEFCYHEGNKLKARLSKNFPFLGSQNVMMSTEASLKMLTAREKSFPLVSR